MENTCSSLFRTPNKTVILRPEGPKDLRFFGLRPQNDEVSFVRTPKRGLTPFVFLIGLALAFLLPSLSFAAKSEDLPHFSPVNEWFYRGAQPSENGFKQLKKKGIRTVVNFRHESKRIEEEREKVEALGMKYVSLPWNITRSVDPKLLDQFFEVLDGPKNRPVFFHCEHGRDRTGVMSTLVLMRYNKLSKGDARDEALETIHPNLQYRYFVNKKIDFFLKERKDAFSESASGG